MAWSNRLMLSTTGKLRIWRWILNFCYRYFLMNYLSCQTRLYFETVNPQTIIFERNFDSCQLAKAKHMFREMKAALRPRVSVPLLCPVKAGLIKADCQLRLSDIGPLMKVLFELKRFSPTSKHFLDKHIFNMILSVTTKINNIDVFIGALEVRNVSTNIESGFKLLRELFHLETWNF